LTTADNEHQQFRAAGPSDRRNLSCPAPDCHGS
jgi:hypothetical protein